MDDRKLRLTRLAMPVLALAFCLAGCNRQEAKAPATADEKAAVEAPTEPATPPEPTPSEEEVAMSPPPPPPPPPPPLPVCPGDPRCEGGGKAKR